MIDKNKSLSNEFDTYRSKILSIIEETIMNENLAEAKMLIKEYEDIVQNDINIYSIKAVLAIKENRLDDAESIINEGLLIDDKDFDLLFNKAYIMQQKGNVQWSCFYYNEAKKYTKNIEIKNEINKILGIEATENNSANRKRILIGSPIHQSHKILKEFLDSLSELNTDYYDISYIFIDNNTDEKSSELLSEFKKNIKNVDIYKYRSNMQYICDNVTHHWKEDLVWKVAKFKSQIIQIALEKGYDYLFLIDSDIVLHPDTLLHLVSDKKDIISNIFWTKWTPNSIELPQVWIKDTYTLYESYRNEQLSEGEKTKRLNEFINMLRKPGVYEVGGLGACTLISKEALSKGVNFREIKNLSFWGEDRHFCIRAHALGLELYVDTHYPAFHIYREDDLKKVNDYKNGNKKKITLVQTNNSGSNTFALFKNIPDAINKKYNIKFLIQSINENYINEIIKSDLVVLTEGNYILSDKNFNPNQIVIDLWHGFPLKAMGYEDNSEKYKDKLASVWKNINYITSYSEKFNEVMNRCINIPMEKYVITGAPRNDLLIKSNGKENLSKLIGKDIKNKNIVFFMPTYRYASRGNRKDGNKNRENIFGFERFDFLEFNDFLESNNILLLLKLHPAEESQFINSTIETNNIIKLTNQMLYSKNMDLYEVLNACNVLITDYSSVYFDFILLDRPVLFTPVDYNEYEENRGFLLKPYDEWTPGPKVYNQEKLMSEIVKSINHSDYYSKERNDICKIVHNYLDQNSCERVWKFIDMQLSSK